MKKRIIKASFITVSIFIITMLLLIAFRGIKKDIESNMKRKGFDIILEKKDICSFAFNEDILYAGGSDGLYEIDIVTLSVKKIGDFTYIRALLYDGTALWVGHDAGLSKIFADGSEKVFTTDEFLPDNRVNALMLDSKNRLWIGTWGGAVMIDNGKITNYNINNGLPDNMVNVIFEDSRRNIWFGSYVAPRGGISVLSGSSWQYFTTKDDLLHANITAIIETYKESIIVGGGLYTRGGGTEFVYTEDHWVKDRLYTIETGLAGEKIRSLYEDSENRLWIGSEYDGLVIYYINGSIIIDETCGLSCNEVKVIIEDSYNNMWIGTRSGVTRIEKGALIYE